MTRDNTKNADYIMQLNDIISRYELSLPISTEQLLSDLETLDNPYEVIRYFANMHTWVADRYGDVVAEGAMPEISSIHSSIIRPNLGGLTFKELEVVLRDLQTETKLPEDALTLCHARADMASFLTYVRDDEPLLTKTLRQINRKSIAEINALMVEPQQSVHDYGTVTFTDRDEYNFWHISMLRSLAQTAHMTYVRYNRLHISKSGAGWLKLAAASKTETLFRSWCEVANWSFWNDHYHDVANIVQNEQHMVYQAILALDKKFGSASPQSLDDICAILCGVNNEPDEYDHCPFSHVSYSLIIRPLIYFGLASYLNPQKDYMSKNDFALTDLGRWMLHKAVCEQWSRKKH